MHSVYFELSSDMVHMHECRSQPTMHFHTLNPCFNLYMQGYYKITLHIVVVDIGLYLSLYEVYMHIQNWKTCNNAKKNKGRNI